MKKTKIFLHAATIVVFGLSVVFSAADVAMAGDGAGLPSGKTGKPRTYEKKAFFQKINYGSRVMRTDTLKYKLGNIVPVHTLTSGLGSLASLRTGDEIRFTLTERNGQTRVTEIWVLPEGTLFES